MAECGNGTPSSDYGTIKQRVQNPDMSQADMFRRNNTVDSLVSPPGTHPAPSPPGHAATAPPSGPAADFMHRRCSLIREESMEEDEGEEVEERDVHSSRSLEDQLSDDSTETRRVKSSGGKDVPTHDNNPVAMTTAAVAGNNAQIVHARKTVHMRPLHSVRSSPQLLNQIYEEGESDDDMIIPHKISTLPAAQSSAAYHQRNIASASPEILKRVERRKKRLTAGSRGTSCSSSDASDTDETDQHKRKEKLKHRFPRRDSSDHSSDTDGPGAPPGGSSGGSGNRPLGGNSGRDGNNRDDDNNQDKNKRDKSWRGSNGGSSSSGGSGRQQKGAELDTEKRRKLSGLSVTSHLSNLSLSSLSSRSSKYLPDTAGNTLTGSGGGSDKGGQSGSDLDIDAMNEENKHRTHVIHVRSRDFSDLMDTFAKSRSSRKIEDAENVSTSSGSGGGNKETSSTATTGGSGKNGKLRRRSKDKMKMDINRNGLKSDIINMSNTAADSQQRQGEAQITPKTKCCRLI